LWSLVGRRADGDLADGTLPEPLRPMEAELELGLVRHVLILTSAAQRRSASREEVIVAAASGVRDSVASAQGQDALAAAARPR